MNIKRVSACTILGALAGVVCYLGGKSSGINFTLPLIYGTVLNRALIGFVIGISGWKKINYLLHGAIIGLIVTLPMAVMGPIAGAIILSAFGIIYGVIIELVATKLLKLKI